MRTLISCVGDTDPIRNYHDGPLLHIVRNEKPEKIILIHSERSASKHDAIEKAIRVIPDYEAEIVMHPATIKDSDVFLFDKMFEMLSGIVLGYYKHEEEILLNLTSATPQIISAMFAINRIAGLNVRAFQVATPANRSNEGIRHESNEDIDTLISLNVDNQVEFESRLIEDKGEQFNQILLKKTLLDLLDQYDYEGVYELSVKHRILSKKKRSTVNRKLENVLNMIRYQMLLPEVEGLNIPHEEKVLLNGYLIIAIQAKRKLTSEVLIRIQNIAEYTLEYYLNKNIPGLIRYDDDNKPFINGEAFPAIDEHIKREQKNKFQVSYLNLHKYIGVLEYLAAHPGEHENTMDVERLLDQARKIQGARKHRNTLAHRMDALNPKQIRLNDWVETTRQMIALLIRPEDKWHSYFENLNREMESLITD